MDYNEALMAEIANQGGGRFYHVTQPHQLALFIAGELGEAASIVAREVELVLNLPPGATVSPLS
ncbi:MAG TPA: hypothetical protein PKH23_05370, partial [Bacillota bacterium]|nr:hypothetical protein [Bacillota bacterium]